MEVGYTTSVCNTVVRGTHQFMIADYSLHKQIGVGQFIRSTIFNIGGYDWAIRYYPDGLNNRNKKFISISVELLTPNVEVRVQLGFRLLGDPQNTEWRIIGATKVSSKEGSIRRIIGYDKFFERSTLEAWESLKNDRFVIECHVAVRHPIQVITPETEVGSFSEVNEIPPSELSNDMGKILVSNVGADIAFSVQDKIFYAHRAVLVARSTVFKEELRDVSMVENNEEPTLITVDTDMSPDIFAALIFFLYTDTVFCNKDLYGTNGAKEFLLSLLRAADRYALERLKIICESVLCKTLDVETVATTFIVAVNHKCDYLKESCLNYMVSPGRLQKVMATQAYESLRSKSPELAVQVLESVCTFRPKEKKKLANMYMPA